MGVGVGIDVGTQTDGDVVGEVLEVGDFWAGDTFGDGETLCDDYLDSAVMLQRAAAATFEIHKMKTNVESDAAGASGVEMTLLESPRWVNFNFILTLPPPMTVFFVMMIIINIIIIVMPMVSP